jgi:hypothetical protein
VLGQTGASGYRSFFRSMEDWHRWLAQEGRDSSPSCVSTYGIISVLAALMSEPGVAGEALL